MAGWTKAEQEILASNVQKLTPRELTELLPGRTSKAILARAHRTKVAMRFNWWEKDEDEIIAANAANMSARELMGLLPGRSRSAIIARAHRLRATLGGKPIAIINGATKRKGIKRPRFTQEEREASRQHTLAKLTAGPKRDLREMLRQAVMNTIALGKGIRQ